MTVHWLSAYLTAPGAVVRAFLEHLILRILRVPVEDTAYMQRNELCGHVEHKPVQTLGKSGVLCLIPGVWMLLFGAALWIPAAIQLFYMGVSPVRVDTGAVSVMFIVCAVFYYLGVCCLCHAFPSYEDALYLSDAFRSAKLPVKVLLFLPVQCARIGAFLQRYGILLLFWIVVTVCLIVF